MRRACLSSAVSGTIFLLISMSAQAATFPSPQVLPFPTGGATSTAVNDGSEEPIFETAKRETTKCKAFTSRNGQQTDTLGTFTITFTSCKESVLNTSCTTKGDSAGVVLAAGSFHYVVDTLGATLGANGVALLITPSTTEFECDGGLTKLHVTGAILCSILEPLVSRRTHLSHCVQSAGQQLEQSYWDDNGTLVTGVFMLVAKNGGTPEQSGQLALAQVSSAEPVAIMSE